MGNGLLDPIKDALDPPIRDHRICFVHVPKCGGTTLVHAIQACFSPWRKNRSNQVFNLSEPAARQCQETTGKSFEETRSALLDYALALPTTRCVLGHFVLSSSCFETHAGEWKFVTVLRDPVERFLSHYFYNLDAPGDHGISADLGDFLQTPRAANLGMQYPIYLGGDVGLGRDVAPGGTLAPGGNLGPVGDLAPGGNLGPVGDLAPGGSLGSGGNLGPVGDLAPGGNLGLHRDGGLHRDPGLEERAELGVDLAEAVQQTVATLRRFSLVGRLENLGDFATRFREKFGGKLKLERRNVGDRRKKEAQLEAVEEHLPLIREICGPDLAVYEGLFGEAVG